ncbi:MAG: hypothetical protein ACM3ML_15665 [Micromonosporaceae bacterium]
MQRLADRISAVFVPVAIALSLATLGYWLLQGAGPGEGVHRRGRRAHHRLRVRLTGDNERTVHAVAAAVCIDDVIAEVMPAGKAAVIKRMQEQGRVVAMADDGVSEGAWREEHKITESY